MSRVLGTNQSGTRGRTLVLVVDDLALNRLMLTEVLVSSGYRVIQAANGREAIDKIDKFHPDIVLMDVEMPVMDGIAAVRELRANEKYRHLPIIAVTSLRGENVSDMLLRAGFSAYIAKPCSLEHLKAVTKTLLE